MTDDTMTDQELDELEQKAKAATSGEWEASGSDEHGAYLSGPPMGRDGDFNLADAAFIAAANPATVLDLVAEIRRRRAVQAAAETALDAVDRYVERCSAVDADFAIPDLHQLRSALDAAGYSDEWGPAGDPALLERARLRASAPTRPLSYDRAVQVLVDAHATWGWLEFEGAVQLLEELTGKTDSEIRGDAKAAARR